MTSRSDQGDDLRCVWMVAGVVSWKLCDRGFVCGRCPLDLALRPSHGGQVDAEAHAFPDDRRYHSGHTWAQTVGPDTVRTGLDGFVARLLGPTRSCVLLPTGARVARGRAGAWVVVGDEPIGLPMPVSGRVVRVNPELTTYPWLVTADPYGAGWLLECAPEGPAPLAGLLDSAGIAGVSEGHLDAIRSEATRASRPGSASVGATAADGGPPRPDDLRHHLGPDRWARLLRLVLEPVDPSFS